MLFNHGSHFSSVVSPPMTLNFKISTKRTFHHIEPCFTKVPYKRKKSGLEPKTCGLMPHILPIKTIFSHLLSDTTFSYTYSSSNSWPPFEVLSSQKRYLLFIVHRLKDNGSPGNRTLFGRLRADCFAT